MFQYFPFDINYFSYNRCCMDKKAALDAFLARCFEARIAPTKVCQMAKVSPANPGRWARRPETMSATALGKLEVALTAYERERLE
jgi:hypothetical protein